MAKNSKYRQKDGIMASALPEKVSKYDAERAVDATTDMVVETRVEMTVENKKLIAELRPGRALSAMKGPVEKPLTGVRKNLLSNRGKKAWNA